MRTTLRPGTPATRHTICLLSAYGELLESEQVADEDLAAALHRFYLAAMVRASAAVVLDGVTHSRNAFLEFVRHFEEAQAREVWRGMH